MQRRLLQCTLLAGNSYTVTHRTTTIKIQVAKNAGEKRQDILTNAQKDPFESIESKADNKSTLHGIDSVK